MVKLYIVFNQTQLKSCEELLNSGTEVIYLHCLGQAISKGLNLSLNLVNSFKGFSYSIHTSTIQSIDEIHPFCDDDDIKMHCHNSSGVHIKIFMKDRRNV